MKSSALEWNMKSRILFLSVILLSFSIVQIHGLSQDVKWKGTIEDEDGIKVIRNPKEPLYGEITFELEEDLSIGNEEDESYMFYQARDIKVNSQGDIFVLDAGNHRVQKFDKNGTYIQTIGKKGQGPGEFADTYEMFIDNQNILYVSGMRMIHIFNNKGEFIRNVAIPITQINFAVNTNGNFVLSGFITSEKGQNYGVFITEPDGKIIKNISEFPGINIFRSGKSMLFLSHKYSPMLCLSAVNNKGVIYGYSPEYKLYFLNQKEDIDLVVRKDESYHAISRGEKDEIINKRHESTSGRKMPKDIIEEAANFSKYRPFYNKILSDDKGRIYVKKAKSVLEESKEIEFDIFSSDGYYLYKISLPVSASVIKNGYLYFVSASEETGVVRIKRFKIKNWNQLKTGIN